jgi:hypothetical protein
MKYLAWNRVKYENKRNPVLITTGNYREQKWYWLKKVWVLYGKRPRSQIFVSLIYPPL